MSYSSNRALELLRIGTGSNSAMFHADQEEAIRHVVENRGRLLLVQRAGWGKSFVYFIATKLLREQGAGPALLVSPLLALMRNQIDAAKRMGVIAERIDSSNTEDWERIAEQVSENKVDILLVSPERLANVRFINDVLGMVSNRISLLVVDEAHCISDWGHDFRPDYQRIDRIIGGLPQNLRLLATTATVNNRVMRDLEDSLGHNVGVMHGKLGLPSVKLQTIRMPDRAERMAWLADTIPYLNGSGIVYCLTIRDAERIAEWLQNRGINALAYHGQISHERPRLEQQLLDNEVKCLVATTALGMGFDKPDLGFVIHYQTPASVVAYYQQVGRAGRAIDAAYGVLLNGEEDDEINDHFISSAFPTLNEANEILNALDAASDGLSIREIESKVNVSPRRIEQSMKILALESPAPIVKEGSKWQRTAASIPQSFWDRVERLTSVRRAEVEQMQDYVNLDTRHMRFLIEAMDGTTIQGASNVELPNLPAEVRHKTVLDALRFLRGETISFHPRKSWPNGAYKYSSVIAPDYQAQEGRAVCIYGDAGWGRSVRDGKYSKMYFDDELVDAAVDLFNRWHPDPSPEWVTCINSARDPLLVTDLAQRIAAQLQLPFIDVLTKKPGRPEQKDMNNNAHKVRNVASSIEIDGDVEPGPVLLIDDIVDSGWTFTVAAWKLLDRGAGPVWPLALASKGNRR